MTTASLPRFQPAIQIAYSPAIEAEISYLSQVIARVESLCQQYHPRWLAIQLLEGDDLLLDELRTNPDATAVTQALQQSTARLQQSYGDDLDVAMADHRYQFVHQLVRETLTRPLEPAETLSDKIDRVVTHSFLGIPIFLFAMYLVFYLVQHVSAPYLDWIDSTISGPVTHWFTMLLMSLQSPAWLISLVSEGVLAGVGGVLVFIPGLMILYAALAVLEDSGYMTRAAFVMDRLMSMIGLHGKAFLPMIVGFGCNVPAVYATRTIENRPARVLTSLMIPFMSCSARLPIYVIFGMAFFPQHAGYVIMGLYTLGIVVASVLGIVLSRMLFQDEQSAFVMELPSYRMPSARNIWRYTWQQTSQFVKKAFTLILGISIILWFLLHLPWGVANPRESWYGQISATAAPLFAPAGFGTWEATGALISGLTAKEVVVSSLAQVYLNDTAAEPAAAASVDVMADLGHIVVGFAEATIGAGQQLLEGLTPGITLFPAAADTRDTTNLSMALQHAFTPLSALAFLVFVLLYIPCVPTIGALMHELGWQWTSLTMALQTILPWLLAVAVYQGGLLLGWQ